MKGKINCSFILLLIFSFSTFFTASAAENDGYYSSSMILNLKGKPGDVLTGNLRFFNGSSGDATAKFAMRDFVYENGVVTYEKDRPESFSVEKWSTLNVKEQVVKTKGYIDLDVTVKIPKNAEQGEHMALLEGSFLPAASEDSQMKIVTEISPVVYVVVTDKTGKANFHKEWKLLNFSKDVINGGKFIFSVKNFGNVHLESQGTVSIKNILTGKNAKSKIPKVNLLPNYKKDILVDWKIDDLIGIYKANIHFSMDGKRFVNEGATLFVIPWTLLGIILAVLILTIVSTRLFLKRLKKKWLAEAANNSNSTNQST